MPVGRRCRTAAQRDDQWILIPCSEPGVDFRDKLRKLGHIPLRKTAENDQFPYFPGLFTFRRIQYCLDGFFLGVTYEAAGIY